jgi:oligosaccharyltransferase complex subunit alpha (ribophorin I)
VRYHKTVYISQWGNDILVEENFFLRNNGAGLKGEFSRIDYGRVQYRSGNENFISEIQLKIPNDASNIYYKDEVGNVSTSALVDQRDSKILVLKPRFPLCGGWNTTWYNTYHLPLNNYLEKDGGRYKLTLESLFSSFKDWYIENFSVEIVFAEGSE